MTSLIGTQALISSLLILILKRSQFFFLWQQHGSIVYNPLWFKKVAVQTQQLLQGRAFENQLIKKDQGDGFQMMAAYLLLVSSGGPQTLNRGVPSI